MVLDNEILEFQNYIMAKYAIHSLDEAKEICKGKGLDIEKIVKDVKPTSQEECVLAFWTFVVEFTLEFFFFLSILYGLHSPDS